MKIQLLLLFSFFSSLLFGRIEVPPDYHSIVERLIYYKDDAFRMFYGGPIISKRGPQWVMNAVFGDENNKTRAVYEISFINCNPTKEPLSHLPVYYLQVSDIDVKFQNQASEAYRVFSSLINNQEKMKQYVVIREVDVSNTFYPDLFISAVYSNFLPEDKQKIMDFLSSKFGCHKKLSVLSSNEDAVKRQVQALYNGLLEQKKVTVKIHGTLEDFFVSHFYFQDDDWKSYYVVTKAPKTLDELTGEDEVLLRLDSGCMSGQIYNDVACDCLDQLHHALSLMAASPRKDCMLIHIPMHDGRGFGAAPKAETEIYKSGGKGRIHSTAPIDTIQAAILLYNTNHFDIRSFRGCAKLLKRNNIQKVGVLTDNKAKIADLESEGLIVRRKPTHTNKMSCLKHIKAKKSSSLYFKDEL